MRITLVIFLFFLNLISSSLNLTSSSAVFAQPAPEQQEQSQQQNQLQPQQQSLANKQEAPSSSVAEAKSEVKSEQATGINTPALPALPRVLGEGEFVKSFTRLDRNEVISSISTHKKNYFLIYNHTLSSPRDDRLEKEVKYQISFKFEFPLPSVYRLFFGYTQLSLWQVYDQERSRPFRENNYNPEVFVRPPLFKTLNYGMFQLDAGLEHESNGQNVPQSRSWNRLYLYPKWLHEGWLVGLKAWYRLPEEDKEDELDPTSDDNPDIHEYYGNAQLYVNWVDDTTRVYFTTRWNPNHGQGMVKIEYARRIAVENLFFMVQYFNGYGESLIDYDVFLNKIGFGILLF